MTRRRFLRPQDVVPAVDAVWAFDAFQPVAAVVDMASGAIRRLVSWPQIGPYSSMSVAGCGGNVWLQPSIDGPLIRVGPAGVESRTDVGDVGPLEDDGPRWEQPQRVVLATAVGAWTVPVNPSGSEMTTQPDALPRRPIGSSALRFTTARGRSRRIMLDGRVLQTASSGGSAYVHVEFGPARRSQVPILGPEQRPVHLANLPTGTARWALRYRRGWLRLPDDGLLVDSVTVTTDALVERPSARRPWQPWYETMLGARDS